MASGWRTYALAVGAPVVSIGLRLLLEPVLHGRSPFLTHFLAVFLTAWYGGPRPGLVSVLVSALLTLSFFPQSRGWGALAFAATAAACAALAGFQRSLLERARKAETQERETRIWFEHTLRSIGDGVVVTDRDGHVVLLNGVASSLTGWSLEDAAGRPIQEVVRLLSESTREPISNPAMLALVQGCTTGLENHTVLVSRDGQEYAVDDTAAPVRNQRGEIGGAVLVFRDITARREEQRNQQHTAEDLRLSELRFRTLYDSGLVGIAYWTADGKVTEANDTYLSLLGFSREEFEAAGCINWRDHTPEEFRGPDEEALRRMAESGVTGIWEKEFVRRDGIRVAALLGAAALNHGGHDGIAFVLDSTARKQAERKLAQALDDERRRAAQLDGLAHAAVEVGAAGNTGAILEVVARQARQLTGATDCVATSGTVRPEGEFPLSATLRGRNGETLGFLALHRKESGNFTEADRGILLQLCEIASMAIERARLNESLQHANRAMERANEDLQQFTRSASHDLQEPLRMATSYLQLLAKRSANKLNEQEQEYLGFALEGSTRMAALLKALREFWRSTAALGEDGQPADCNVVMRTVLDNLKTALEESGAEVRYENMPVVTAGEVPLIQILQNLVGNAIKYRGGRRPEISVEAESSGQEWILSVRDNGIGMSPRDLRRIFQPFTRLHNREISGSGLGLAICQRIVERYGGRIWAESVPEQGSTFRFTIPARPARAGAPGIRRSAPG